MATIVICVALFLTSAVGQPDNMKAEFDKLQAKKHHLPHQSPLRATIQADDCWNPTELPIRADAMSLLQAEADKNVPGAGIAKFRPFKTVLKDGFQDIDCVKDYMYYRGDKFGDNKHDYKLAHANVSIVHYDAFVKNEDRVPMTPARCFEFCRTVPNMGFFGLVNGRSCYCTPYYTAMESSDEQCDSVCEGDSTQMCGGESKSSVFAMHFCDSTSEDLQMQLDLAEAMENMMRSAVKKSTQLSNDMQRTAASLQKSLGAVGDSGAANLMQEAKVFAGVLVHTAEKTETLLNTFDSLQKDAKSLKSFKDPATVTKSERIMEGVTDTAEESKDLLHSLVLQESLATGATETPQVWELMQPADEQEGEEQGMEDMGRNEAHDIAPAIDANKYFWGPWKFLGRYHSRCRKGSSCSTRWTNERCAKKAANTPQCMGHFTRWYNTYDGKYRNYNRPYEYEYCYCIGAPIETAKLNTCRWCERSKQRKWHWQYSVQVYEFRVETPARPFDQYYPAMYFVDKDYQKVPATCSGPLAAKPVVGGSKDACASACDANIHSCVGFQYFKHKGKELCFLFSGFNTGFYYTGCGKSFLQTEKAPYEAGCYAKLSKFVGTTLKPNPSGKCKECFKELTKADRCYK